ncbi:MAG TPA: hypothetical protein VGB82_04640 [Alphaproteobacteria bacterium]
MRIIFTGPALAAALSVLLPAPSWSQGKQPPSCAAINFRPIPAGMPDGQQDAGLYRSRFGLIEVKGTVKGGQPQGYYVMFNNKRLDDASNLPPSVASCAQAKKLAAPGKSVEACSGDALKVLVEHDGNKRYFVLYARQGGQWQVCNAGTA